MFQFLRRVSGSFLPRPDRPWRDDATSHAPTIGRKRRHSVTEHDGDASAAKRTKSDPVEPDAERDPCDEGDRVQAVTEVARDVQRVDLEDGDGPEDPSSICPEGVPLPDSPSASPEPASESQEPAPEAAESDEVEETEDQDRVDNEDSVASSVHDDDAEGEDEVESVTTNTDEVAAPAPEVAVESVKA